MLLLSLEGKRGSIKAVEGNDAALLALQEMADNSTPETAAIGRLGKELIAAWVKVVAEESRLGTPDHIIADATTSALATGFCDMIDLTTKREHLVDQAQLGIKALGASVAEGLRCWKRSTPRSD